MVIDNNLLNLKKIISEQKHLSKEEKKINKGIKPFQRFMNKEEYDNLVWIG